MNIEVDVIYNEDSLTGLQRLLDECVDCVITSPPYWGLRDYGVSGQLGLEPTIEEYISNMTVVFREVWRVLKDTGTLWLNMGDSYAGSGGAGEWSKRKAGKQEYAGQRGNNANRFVKGKRIPRGSGRWGGGNNPAIGNLKPKDLCGIPWRLALALQADGWYLRSDIIWHKPNPMPESVTDRPTKSHEYLFLLSKRGKYFYDAEAVREQSNGFNKMPDGWDTSKGAHGSFHREGREKGRKKRGHIKPHQGFDERWDKMTKAEQGENGRNKRTVWTIATQPYPEAHFATFPEKLVESCIRAGTSERGNCAKCGKPWVRVVEETDSPRRGVNSAYPGKQTLATQKYKHDGSGPVKHTLGWKPSCSCGADTVRPIVLDPFMGSGTVGLVAKKLNRDYIGIELNPEYIKMAEKRIRGEMGLFVRSN